MRFFIITGVSSGLGEAFADLSSREADTTVIGVSRRGNRALEERVLDRGGRYFDHRIDLSRSSEVAAAASEVFAHLNNDEDSEIVLINNAAVEGPLAPVGQLDDRGIIGHVAVNLTACMLLSSMFIRFTQDWGAQRTIVNITSGAAQHPYDGMSAYCASKAGLDMFGRCLALEQEKAKNPVRILAIAPGVLDTPMQNRIRQVDEALFPAKARFVTLKEEGKLSSPTDSARRILSLVYSGSFESGAVLDLRTLT